MKVTKALIVLFVFLMIFSVSCKKDPLDAKKALLDTEEKKTSYAVGYDMGNRSGLKDAPEEIKIDSLIQGFSDAIKGDKSPISDEERKKIIENFKEASRVKYEAKQKAMGEKNKKEGEAFLAENAKKEGIKTTASGLQYEVITEGTGANPSATDKVKVHYRGTLINGTEFDSSYKTQRPASFYLNRVIKGWTEGVQLMKVGSKYRFFIPSDLAYGPQGAGQLIGPNATLIFEVELLDIVTPK